MAPLSALVRDPEPKVRLAVVQALAALRDLSGVPALVTSLQDGDPKVREEAISALVQIYAEGETGGAVARFLQRFSDEYTEPSVPPFTVVDPAVFAGLAGRLADEENGIRVEAAQAIGILGGDEVSDRLVASLQDPDAGVRGAAVTALSKVGTAEQGKALIPLLADTSSDVRNRTIQAIGVLQVKEAGPALREMYTANERRTLATRVLGAMARTRDPNQADLYRELLVSGDLERRRLAVEGLARVSDPSMIDGFKKDFQRETNEDVRLAYNFAITLLGDEAFLDSIVLALSAAGQPGRACSRLHPRAGPADRSGPLPLPRGPGPRRPRRTSPASSPRWATPTPSTGWIRCSPTPSPRWPTPPTGRFRACVEPRPAGNETSMKRTGAPLLAVLLLGGCQQGPAPVEATGGGPHPEARALVEQGEYDGGPGRAGRGLRRRRALPHGPGMGGEGRGRPPHRERTARTRGDAGPRPVPAGRGRARRPRRTRTWRWPSCSRPTRSSAKPGGAPRPATPGAEGGPVDHRRARPRGLRGGGPGRPGGHRGRRAS